MTCPDCLSGEHPRSDCPAWLPCPYWADRGHCFRLADEMDLRRTKGAQFGDKVCFCGAVVRPHAEGRR